MHVLGIRVTVTKMRPNSDKWVLVASMCCGALSCICVHPHLLRVLVYENVLRVCMRGFWWGNLRCRHRPQPSSQNTSEMVATASRLLSIDTVHSHGKCFISRTPPAVSGTLSHGNCLMKHSPTESVSPVRSPEPSPVHSPTSSWPGLGNFQPGPALASAFVDDATHLVPHSACEVRPRKI